MGMSDNVIFPYYAVFINEQCRLDDINRCAILGAPCKFDLLKLLKSFGLNAEIHFYDIVCEEGEFTHYWDINGSWADIAGYDLIICTRTSLFAKDADQFMNKLRALVEENEHVFFDFEIGHRPLLEKQTGLNARYCFGRPLYINIFIVRVKFLVSFDGPFINCLSLEITSCM